MPIPIPMPRLSDTMQQGTIVKWNVKEGQKVKTGETIADIETDKATMELQSFDDGTVAVISVPQGQAVPVGTVMMVLAAAGEDPAVVKAQALAGGVSAAASTGKPAGASATSAVESKPVAAGAIAGGVTSGRNAAGTTLVQTNGSHAETDRVFASPLARKIAEESGVDLSRVQGSGPAGRIVRKDIEDFLATGSPAQPFAPRPVSSGGAAFVARNDLAPSQIPPAIAGKTVPLSTMRRIIAQRLSESKGTIPHYQVTFDMDMTPLATLRAQLNEQLSAQGVKLSVNDFLVRACALAMRQHPGVNARFIASPGKEAIEYLAEVNVGVAIALPLAPDGTGGGLVVATLRNADTMGLRQISSQTKHLADKARAKGLSPQEMEGATFTISNLGMFGVAHFNAIINPPNVAILAVGAAIEKPVVRDGQVVPGLVMSMTMSSDHRVVDGAMAAQYLGSVKESLEKPATLLV